ncbi:hypothetical protein ACF08A_25750 [Streptomyces cellulosae]
MIMTPHQVLAVAALGGLAALLGLVLIVGVACGVFHLVSRLVDQVEDRRARRTAGVRPEPAPGGPPAADDLATCRAIDALGTTHHPADD